MRSLQKRIAAKILKVGQSRVWLDPTRKKEIEEAITKADIRKLIKKGAIKALPEKIKVQKEKRKKKGRGRGKGAKYAVFPRKERWMSIVRALREMLKEMKKRGEIENQTFKRLYRLIKGGMFRSKSHLRIYMEQHGLIKKRKKNEA